MSASLALDRVSSGYGESVVLHNVSLEVGENEAVALLGKNGMGKSTLLKAVMGFLSKKSGSVSILGRDVTQWKPHKVAQLGVSYAAQEHSLFADLSIYDNLSLGLRHMFLFKELFDEIIKLFPVFEDRLQQHAGTLSGGEQKMLLVARTLMMCPKVILLDEITEGLQPSIVDRLAEALLQERKRRKTSMLIIEQNISFALRVADRYLILKQGEISDQGGCGDVGAAAVIMNYFHV
jgi:branched-chain amino acid transport system ATP-binding protein